MFVGIQYRSVSECLTSRCYIFRAVRLSVYSMFIGNSSCKDLRRSGVQTTDTVIMNLASIDFRQPTTNCSLAMHSSFITLREDAIPNSPVPQTFCVVARWTHLHVAVRVDDWGRSGKRRFNAARVACCTSDGRIRAVHANSA